MPLFRKRERITEVSETGESGPITLRQREVGTGEREPELNLADWAIIFIGVILLIAFIFLFDTVLPEWGFIIYKNAMIYLWKPISWMPLWVGILVVLGIYTVGDFFKPVLVYGPNKTWYIHKKFADDLWHFYTLRSLGRRELVVHKDRIVIRGFFAIVTVKDLTIKEISKRQTFIEGHGIIEVTQASLTRDENRMFYSENRKLRDELAARDALRLYELERLRKLDNLEREKGK